MKTYIETTKRDGNKKTSIKAETWYNRDGIRRGYVLNVRVVEIEEHENYSSESFSIFGNDTAYVFLLEVNRASPKAAGIAERIAHKKLPSILVDMLTRTGLKVSGANAWITEPVEIAQDLQDAKDHEQEVA